MSPEIPRLSDAPKPKTFAELQKFLEKNEKNMSSHDFKKCQEALKDRKLQIIEWEHPQSGEPHKLARELDYQISAIESAMRQNKAADTVVAAKVVAAPAAAAAASGDADATKALDTVARETTNINVATYKEAQEIQQKAQNDL